MNRTRGSEIFLVVLLCCVLAVVWVPILGSHNLRNSKKASDRLPPIRITPGSVQSFGKVWAGEKVTKTFTLTNISDQELQIADVRTSCGCTTSARTEARLAPSTSLELPLTLDSTSKAGHVQETVALIVKGYPKPVALTLSGEVVEQWPSTVQLGTFLNTQAQIYHGKIVDRHEPLTITGIQYDNMSFEVSWKRVQDGIEFVIKTKPTISQGEFREVIELITNDDWQPAKTIAVLGESYRRIEAHPPVISLGTFSADQTPKPVRIEVRSKLNQKFRIVGVLPDLDILEAHQLEATSSPIKDSPRQMVVEVRLKDNPPPGMVSGAIHLITDDPETHEITVPIFGMAKKPEHAR